MLLTVKHGLWLVALGRIACKQFNCQLLSYSEELKLSKTQRTRQVWWAASFVPYGPIDCMSHGLDCWSAQIALYDPIPTSPFPLSFKNFHIHASHLPPDRIIVNRLLASNFATMSRRTVFTTLTSLPTGITREIVLESLHNHVSMIDLNPLVEERHAIKAPAKATPEEFHCIWYSMTDKVQYLPGGMYSGKVTYSACFHDLSNGLQTHCYAPMGLDIKGKWTVGGTLPHEPVEPVEMGLGAPKHGLWLREDVDMKCNILMTSFVKKTLKKAHATLVDRLVEKSHLLEAEAHNSRIWETKSNYSYHSSRTDSSRFQAPLASPDLSSTSRFSGTTTSPGFPAPSRSSPEPEGQDRKSYNPYPGVWSSP